MPHCIYGSTFHPPSYVLWSVQTYLPSPSGCGRQNLIECSTGSAAHQSCAEPDYQSFLPLTHISVSTIKLFVNRHVPSSYSTAHC